MGINTIGLNNINLDDDNFGNGDSQTILHVRLMAWHDKYKQHKSFQNI